MQLSNHAMVGEGIKIYLDVMRPFVKQRLIAQFPNNWWEQGVLGYLSRGQRDHLKRNIEHNPGKDKADFLDPGHIDRIIGKEFDRAFKGDFADWDQTASHLRRIKNARDRHAHPESGALNDEEAADALYPIVEILRAIGAPEAEQVEALRRQIQKLDARPHAIREIAPAASGELPYWWQVCEPQDAFKNPAAIDISLFAASLGGVHAGATRDEFKNPELFLAHTYFTTNLKEAIREVASRLNKGPGNAVTELQTPFGGGKTHALLTMYHLFRDPRRALQAPGVREALGDIAMPDEVRVIAFDGYEAGIEGFVKENGTIVETLWGEIAWQAGEQLGTPLFEQIIEASDSGRYAPGNAVYREVLQAASPCLILIDELVSYLNKLVNTTGRRSRALYHQTVQFMQELLQEAGNVPGICILISLPQSQREFGALDSAELQAQLQLLPEIQARADRVVSKRTPVNDDEIYTLMSKRLFQRADPQVAERVARAYREIYQNNPGRYGPEALSEEYRKAQIAAYPLHPELIDVLYKKWSTATDFPRTRTVLQLMALIVADQWVNRRMTYTIQSAHVNLEREQIRTKIISAPGGGGQFEGVIATDIIGGDAHADHEDDRRSNAYAQHHIARGLATSLLMHSFGGRMRNNGALPHELFLSTVAPNVGPEYVDDVLAVLEQRLWYVHREGDIRRFSTKPNIYRIIHQNAEEQRQERVSDRLRDALGKAIGHVEGFRILEWAGDDEAIADRPDPSLAVLVPSYAVSGESEDTVEGGEKIDALWQRSGGGFRQFRNALVLVAPDRELWKRAEEAMREVMAYEEVIDDAESQKLEVSTREMQDLKAQLRDRQDSLRTSVVTAYRWIFAPGEEGLDVTALPVPATRDERIARRVIERLADQNYAQPKVLYKMGGFYFNSKIAPRVWQDESMPLELDQLRRRFPQWTYLPILPNTPDTLRACVRDGVAQGFWAVAIGDNQSMTYRSLIEDPDGLSEIVDLYDGSASLVRGELLEVIRNDLKVEIPPEPVGNGTGKDDDEGDGGDQDSGTDGGTGGIPKPERHSRVRICLDGLEIAKTGNLQPYLFKVIQDQDPLARVKLTVEVESPAGIPEEALNKRIVEGLDMLNIRADWEQA